MIERLLWNARGTRRPRHETTMTLNPPANIFINGQFIGRHKGAFSASAFALTAALKFGSTNTLAVRVSNRESEARNCFSRSTLDYVVMAR